ncbi:hypothetical protein EVJ32_05005 [Exiguobacterium sp. SH5S4]|uniref:hypothetical protein n=1 Tax=Exiguobacterium sp. SH5S4 TaxID=2510961 RepID=UPI00103A5EC0|nr:hypothetical protein [Exiguobacterium sp. SH5S4]TCI26736.1 hypothetical protein EVJ32_05005 [Exiguobacterium sp. SH5S4]
MGKYTKKPIAVEATQYKPGMEDGFDKVFDEDQNHPIRPFIHTLEGRLFFDTDAYIVTGVKGERYAVRKDIFEETYEKSSS